MSDQELAAMYAEGWSTNDLASMFDITAAAVTWRLARAGVKRRRRGRGAGLARGGIGKRPGEDGQIMKTLTALSRGPKTAQQIADELGVTPRAIRSRLASLHRRGFVERIGETPSSRRPFVLWATSWKHPAWIGQGAPSSEQVAA